MFAGQRYSAGFYTAVIRNVAMRKLKRQGSAAPFSQQCQGVFPDQASLNRDKANNGRIQPERRIAQHTGERVDVYCGQKKRYHLSLKIPDSSLSPVCKNTSLFLAGAYPSCERECTQEQRV